MSRNNIKIVLLITILIILISAEVPAQNYSWEYVHELLSTINDKDNFENKCYMLLQECIVGNNTDLVIKIFEEFKPDINKTSTPYDGGNRSHLFSAVKTNNTRLTDYLLDHGADINAGSSSIGFYPVIFIAVENNDIQLVRHLIKKGADATTLFGWWIPKDLLEFADEKLRKNSELVQFLQEYTNAGTRDIVYNHKLRCYSTVNRLRIRSTPAISGEILGHLNIPDKNHQKDPLIIERKAGKVDIDGLSDYWYKITTIDGIEGWVFGGYLKLVPRESGGPM